MTQVLTLLFRVYLAKKFHEGLLIDFLAKESANVVCSDLVPIKIDILETENARNMTKFMIKL